MILFDLKQVVATPGGFRATTSPKVDSVIYKAHFPGNPVTPGACLIQAVCSLVEKHCGCKMLLSEAKSVKFISTIVPNSEDEVVFDVEFHGQPAALNQPPLSVKATVTVGNGICAKMSLLFDAYAAAL